MRQHDSDRRPGLSRRAFLGAAGTAGACIAFPGIALAARQSFDSRVLCFEHLHTGESLTLAYAENGSYVAGAMPRLAHLLRDHYSGDVHPIDPSLLDLLYEVKRRSGTRAPYQVISGYRSRRTNEQLRAKGSRVGRKSLHMEGRAVDVRLADIPTEDLRDLAWSLRRGGVGYYRRSDFVHLDVGRVRRW